MTDRKLFKLEALQERINSDNARFSGRSAKNNIQRRFRQSRENDLLDEDVPDSVGDVIFQAERAPSRQDVIAKIKCWQNGEWRQKDMLRWARSVVDKVFFGEISPDHPNAITAELIMICSAMDKRVWCQADIAALLDFAQSSPEEPLKAWNQWFAYVNAHF